MDDEFMDMQPAYKHLRDTWPAVKDKILDQGSVYRRTNPEVNSVLDTLTDEYDEGMVFRSQQFANDMKWLSLL
jgi:hypothetical protein